MACCPLKFDLRWHAAAHSCQRHLASAAELLRVSVACLGICRVELRICSRASSCGTLWSQRAHACAAVSESHHLLGEHGRLSWSAPRSRCPSLWRVWRAIAKVCGLTAQSTATLFRRRCARRSVRITADVRWHVGNTLGVNVLGAHDSGNLPEAGIDGCFRP